jgi:hypothetical protein
LRRFFKDLVHISLAIYLSLDFHKAFGTKRFAALHAHTGGFSLQMICTLHNDPPVANCYFVYTATLNGFSTSIITLLPSDLIITPNIILCKQFYFNIIKDPGNKRFPGREGS